MAPSLLDSSAGAFLLASFLSSAATGVTTFQAFNYFSSTDRKKEAWVYNAVIILLILDWIMAVMSVVTPYNWLVDNFGNPEVLEFTPWSFNLELGSFFE